MPPHISSGASPERVAVIDLGTNTFNLLIADVFTQKFAYVYTEKEGVALGMGGINEGIIAEDAFQRGVNAVVKFKQICEKYEVTAIHAFGTSALRDAGNTDEFMAAVKSLTGIEIAIITGEEEAQLIYKGVLWSYDFSQRAIIMDIGGGSTEFIVADRQGIESMISLDIGVSRIFQELELHDPLTEADVALIKNWLEERSEGFFDNKQCDVLVGASGSFETFHEMIHKQKFPEGIESQEIPMQQLLEITDWIIGSERAERDNHPFIIPIRRRMAPIAAVKTRWVMDKLAVKRVVVSPCALKEGALSDFWKKDK